jgi:hypothetical protein
MVNFLLVEDFPNRIIDLTTAIGEGIRGEDISHDKITILFPNLGQPWQQTGLRRYENHPVVQVQQLRSRQALIQALNEIVWDDTIVLLDVELKGIVSIEEFKAADSGAAPSDYIVTWRAILADSARRLIVCSYSSEGNPRLIKVVLGDNDDRVIYSTDMVSSQPATSNMPAARTIVRTAFDAYYSLFRQNESRASNWSVETWNRLRYTIKQKCEAMGEENGFGHGLWAHHLPHGGSLYRGRAYKKFVDGFLLTNQLRAELLKLAPEAVNFPHYGWRSEIEDKIEPWDQPPLRALAQFTNGGHDLTAAFYLVSKDVQGLMAGHPIQFSSNLMMPKDFKCDYLWFNISALLYGLYTLAQTFRDEINKFREGERKGNPFMVPCVGGSLYWEIAEKHLANTVELFVHVYQTLFGWSVGPKGDENQFCLAKAIYPLPASSEAQRKVKNGYDYFRKSGATINRCQDGTLELVVTGKKTDDRDNRVEQVVAL